MVHDPGSLISGNVVFLYIRKLKVYVTIIIRIVTIIIIVIAEMITNIFPTFLHLILLLLNQYFT